MPEMTRVSSRKGPFAQQLRRFLSEEGYRPRLEVGDGCPSTLRFKVEGNDFVLRCNEDDPDFIQLSTGYLLDGSCQDELTLLRASNSVQAKTKVIKIFLPDDHAFVEFQVELFLGGHPLSSELLERSIATARHGCREFFKFVTPEAPKALA